MTQIASDIRFAWAALGSSITLSSFAQITLKHTTNRIRGGAGRATAAGWLALWGVLFAGATFCWMESLRRMDISLAYPLLSLGYILVTLLGVVLLRESVSAMRWIAVAIITCGAALVAGSV